MIKAAGIDFAGMDIILWKHVKAHSIYITEINSTPGTGIIDITSKNHYVNVVKYINKVKQYSSYRSFNN